MKSHGRKKSEVAPASGEEADRGQTPRSVQIASEGIRNSAQAKGFLSALISDVMTESVSPKKANTACNAMGKLIKVADLERQHGQGGASEPFNLVDLPTLAVDVAATADPLAEEESALLDRLETIRRARAEVTNGTPAPARKL